MCRGKGKGREKGLQGRFSYRETGDLGGYTARANITRWHPVRLGAQERNGDLNLPSQHNHSMPTLPMHQREVYKGKSTLCGSLEPKSRVRNAIESQRPCY